MDKKKDDDLKIRRDEHNKLDENHAAELQEHLTKKLITTERDVQKELSFRHARTNKRDIVVKYVIYQRNTMNGMVVREDAKDPLFEKLSDDPLDPYRYRYFDHVDGEILVKEMPMTTAKAGKFMHGCFKAVLNYLARMNIFNG